jgi:drug/metabolite transporter (DMT)-like permease
MKIKRIAAFAAISFAWGSMWIAQQELLTPFSLLRFFAIIFSLCAAGLGLAGLCLRAPRLDALSWRSNAILGATLVAAPCLLTVWASPHLSSGIAAVTLAGTPLVAGFFCDAPWSARNASIAGLGGVLLVVGSIVSISPGQLPWAAILLAGTVVTSGSLVFAKKRLTASHPVYSAAIQLATAGAILAAVSYAIRGGPTSDAGSGLPAWGTLLLAAAGNGIAYPLYLWLLKQIRIDQITSTIWAQLLVSVAESVFLLRPHVDWRILLGAAVVAGSIFALARSRRDSQMLTVRVTSLTG